MLDRCCFLHLLYALKFVAGMELVSEDKAEILFLVPLPKDSTTRMPTRVENILPNAAISPLQLFSNNGRSAWLPCIEQQAWQVRVFVGVLYCQRLHNLEISTPMHQLISQLQWTQQHSNAFSESVLSKAPPCPAPNRCAWFGRLRFLLT